MVQFLVLIHSSHAGSRLDVPYVTDKYGFIGLMRALPLLDNEVRVV